MTDHDDDRPASAEAGLLGRRIHAMRTARALTQRELAAPRYTAAYVSSVESGRRMPSSDAVAHFAERLGVSVPELVTGRAPGGEIRAMLQLADADAMAGVDPRGAAARYRRLAAEATGPGEAELRARCHVGLGRLALRGGDLAAAAREFEEAETLVRGARPHLRADALAGRAECVRRGGDPRYAAYLLIRARDDLVQAGLPDPGALLALYAHLAVCHADLGDDAEAASAATAALALAGPPVPEATGELHLTVTRTLLADGDEPGARVALHQAVQAWRQAALGGQLAVCRRARGRSRAAAGKPQAAVSDLAEARRAFADAGDADAAADVGVELAELYRVLGRRQDALALLDTLPASEVKHRTAAAMDRVRGLIATDEGDHRAAERHLRAAVDGYRGGPRHELAAVVLALADLLEGQGQADEALALLGQGLSWVDQGAESWQRAPGSAGPAVHP
jgi:tetratricopeptide (TPR) repeat protein